MKPSEILLEAKKKVEAGWCQRAFATKDDGFGTNSRDPDAIQWCAYGALMSARHPADGDMTSEVWKDVCADIKKAEIFIKALDGGDLMSWNDMLSRTQAEVVQAFEDAYQLALKEETAQ